MDVLAKIEAIPEVLGALLPVERTVFQATREKPVSEYKDRELAVELAGVLKWIAKDIGYRAAEDGEMQYLVIRTAEILKRYYGEFSLKDFRMAFEMSLTGELDDFLPKGRDGQPDRGHYQQFNAEYICKILNAYRGKRRRIIRKAKEAVPKEEQGISEEEKAFYREESRKQCIWAFLHYKYRGYIPGLSPIAEMLCCEMLAGVGLAEEVEIDRKEVLERTIGEIAGKGKKDYRRREALERAFDKIIEEEIQIGDYIR